MIDLIMVIVVTVICFASSYAILNVLPNLLKRLVYKFPILAFALNMVVSEFIRYFAGSSKLIGIANLGASLLFGFVIWKKGGIERRNKKIHEDADKYAMVEDVLKGKNPNPNSTMSTKEKYKLLIAMKKEGIDPETIQDVISKC